MAHEFPVVPPDGSSDNAPAQEPSGPDGSDRVRSLREKQVLMIKEDKGVRIERARLNVERDRVRARLLELRRERLKKQSAASAIRARLREEREKAKDQGAWEIERLERRVDELRENVDAFDESLRTHRRDRRKAFDLLIGARAQFQDLLTERLLWRILESEARSEGGEGRSGSGGITAELLGRLLVVEKEEAQLTGLLSGRRLSGGAGGGTGTDPVAG